jgi:hypothetical protein
MEYYSEFKATWDGRFMKIEEGNLRIPNDPKEYIQYPIEIIEIERALRNQIIGESLIKPRFVTDTPRLKRHSLRGEIIGTNNSRPVVQV